MLENTQNALSVGQLADYVAAEGGVFQNDDVMAQRRAVNKALQRLYKNGIVQSYKSKGHVITWATAAESEKRGAAIAQAVTTVTFQETLSDDDWTLIRKRVPASARREGVQSLTRCFVELVLSERATEGTPRFTPKQRKRFLTWHQLGVWSEIAEALGGRLEEAELTNLAGRLALLD